ncbi:MAG: PQ-loop domain-containing transporter [Gammaproteobacteria bacterium]|nr:PQ-loop domain-containing transporter [Gammaproteobacteria bacterium]
MTVAFVPQAIKTWRSRHARDLSLGMFSLFNASCEQADAGRRVETASDLRVEGMAAR